MARRKSFSTDDIRTNRKLSGLNQQEFWSRFGVTQSGGSRYESGRTIPLPAAILIWLRETDCITDKDLATALKNVRKNK